MNVLKRSICMLLVAVMVLSLVACAAKTATPTTEAPAEKTTEAVATTETASADTAEETTAVSTEETEAEDAPVMLNVMGYDVVLKKRRSVLRSAIWKMPRSSWRSDWRIRSSATPTVTSKSRNPRGVPAGTLPPAPVWQRCYL